MIDRIKNLSAKTAKSTRNDSIDETVLKQKMTVMNTGYQNQW